MKKITKIITLLLIASAALFSCDPALYENLNGENRDESKQTILSPDEMAALTVEVQTDYNTKFDDLNVPYGTYKFQLFTITDNDDIKEISSMVSTIVNNSQSIEITDARSYTTVTAKSTAAKQTYNNNHSDIEWDGMEGHSVAIAKDQDERDMMAGLSFMMALNRTLYTNSSRTRFYTIINQDGQSIKLCLKKIY
ncbi:MAG: hypothetical protein K6E97_04810 [Treponema sp.]|nr:hypothetical protein [Treponema sp.]